MLAPSILFKTLLQSLFDLKLFAVRRLLQLASIFKILLHSVLLNDQNLQEVGTKQTFLHLFF